MIARYLKIAFRHLWKSKAQSFTGIFSLAFSLACFVPALYWMRYETSYDNFYPGSERIYRLYAIEKQSGKVNEMVQEPLVWMLREQFPATEASAGFYPETNVCSAEGTPYIRLRTLLTDNPFFSVFPQTFVSGDAQHALETMYNIVLTETTAVRLFGGAEKAVGRQIQSLYYFFYPPYTVTAVVKDPPPNTNLPFDALLFYRLQTGDPGELFWDMFNTHAYVKLHPGADAGRLDEQLRDYTSRLGVKTDIELRLLPLSDVRHRLNGNLTFILVFIRLFAAFGTLLLFSALFNFLGLHLTLFHGRIREFRLRAVHGATGGRLVWQMTFELACAILPALLLAGCLVVLARPAFSGLLEMEINLGRLLRLFAVCATAATGLTLFAGAIAFRRLSRLATRTSSRVKPAGQPALRPAAVVLQLAVSMALLVATSVVMMQMHFVGRSDLGFDRRGIVQLSGLLPQIRKNLRTALIRELEAIPQIESIAASAFEPQYKAEPDEMVTLIEWPGKAPHEKPAFHLVPTDSRFAETFGLKMRTGAWWKEGGRNKIVLNEEALRVMGLAEAVGTVVRMSIFMSDADYIEEYEIVGVVKDFHTLSLRSRILPTIFVSSDSQEEIVGDNLLYIRVTPGREQEVIRRVDDILPSLDASMAGVSLRPVGELYDRHNQAEQAGLKLFSILAAVCLLIALFGVYALASASTQRRRKEIAIRKIAGATAGSIVRMFLREYIWLVILAALLALPPACLAMNSWLQGYAYRASIPWLLPAGVIAGVAAVVLSAVSKQVLAAAGSNPGEVVKSERG
jgi:putative ABC transport system permease protein